jgi:2-amino-4-hydroxy-6-hydroxymethyldihydropteridine diphosphokinase
MAGAVHCFVGIGSNLGDRAASIEAAVEALRVSAAIQVVRVSNLMEFDAVGGPAGAPPFLNAAAELTTTLGSHALLKRLLEIERDLGRSRRIKWEPRTIDLDLLLYGSSIISSQELVVPHPLMHERLFVLAPLAQIAPDAIHPTLQMTVAGLLEARKLREAQGATDSN